jgi:hypothetical protein
MLMNIPVQLTYKQNLPTLTRIYRSTTIIAPQILYPYICECDRIEFMILNSPLVLIIYGAGAPRPNLDRQ